MKSQYIGREEYPRFLLERTGEGWRVKPEFAGLHDEDFLLADHPRAPRPRRRAGRDFPVARR